MARKRRSLERECSKVIRSDASSTDGRFGGYSVDQAVQFTETSENVNSLKIQIKSLEVFAPNFQIYHSDNQEPADARLY